MSRPLLLLLLVLGGVVIAKPATSETSPPAGQDVRSLIDRGKYAEAEQTVRVRLDALMRAPGTDSLTVASLLDLLTEAMRRGGRGGKPEAREYCERALRIKADRLGRQGPEYAASLYQLGFLDYANSDFGRAKPTLEQALAIRERTLGKDHRDVAESLIPLAGLLSDCGDNAKAESLFTRAQAIRVREFGPLSAEVGECLSAMATLRFRTGDFLEAAETFEQALPIIKRTYGASHPKVGTCMNNLGSLLRELGDYEGAIKYLQQALEIRRKALGRNHELVASTLVNLGNTKATLGQVRDAEKCYDEALAIQMTRFGETSREVGGTRTSLGLLNLQTGKCAKARTILSRAVADLERHGEGDPPELADALAGLATAEVCLGRISAAAGMCERALKIRREALGDRHPDVGLLLNQYARLLSATGQPDAALKAALSGEEISREHLRLTSRGLAERQALEYARTRSAGARSAVQILGDMRNPGGETVAQVWDSVIRGRTLVLDEIASRNRTIASAGDSATREMLEDLNRSRGRLANLLVAGPRGEPPGQYRDQIARARDLVERDERALASRSMSFRREKERERIGMSEVSSSLPKDAVMIGFTVAGDSAARSYAAFVLEHSKDPVVTPLGLVSDLDAKVARWLNDIAQDAARPPGARGALSPASGATLRRAIWDPLAPYVKGAMRVFIVPEGAIHLVNFAALPTGPDAYLIEGGKSFHYLSAERDLVPEKDVPKAGNGLFALGDPTYGGAGRSSTSRYASRRGSESPPPCFDFDSLNFGPLPGTGREVRDVARIWGTQQDVTTLTGASATEGAFKAHASGHRVLHIATHGFFLGKCPTGEARSRGIGGTAVSGPVGNRKPDPRHPLLLAGLALAGANRRAAVRPNEEDGILTAEEISGLDLAGTQWAVLSACDTGNGSVIAGEGIVGLQRAFQVAGVRTVIMSLWAVDDDATREWMDALYQGRVTRKLDTATAVTDASLQVLRERRAQARSTNPFYWAGFVATGDWR